MIHVIGERGSGKTKALIQKAFEDKAVLVTHTVEYTKKLAKSMGIPTNDIRIISYSQFLRREQGSRYKYYIDEVDSLLNGLAHCEIAGISVNMEDNDIVCLPE